MTICDFYFSTPNRAALASALADYGFVLVGANAAPINSGAGWALDYIGNLIEVPAVYDPAEFPPSIVTPAVLFSGQRANLRLSGPNALTQATALASATFPDGIFLIGASDAPDAQRLRWGDDGYPFSPFAPASPPSPASPPTLAAMKQQAKAAVAAKRWEKETAGVAFRDGIVETDRESQLAVLGVFVAAQATPGLAIRWKCQGGSWIDLDAAGCGELFATVAGYKAACFAREEAIGALVDAAADSSALNLLAPTIAAFWE